MSVDIASSYSSPNDRRNLAAGVFELLLDGEVLARHDFGPIDNGVTQRFTLKGMSRVAEGVHEVRVKITRTFRSLPQDDAPRQYLDNIQFMLLPE